MNLFLPYMLIEPEEPDPDSMGGGFDAPEKNEYFSHPYKKIAYIALFCIAVIYIFYLIFISPPAPFGSGERLNIVSGMTVKEAGKYLKDNSIIRSPFLFRLSVWMGGGGVIAGSYLFSEPLTVFEIVKEIAVPGNSAINIKVTIPEGLSNKEVAEVLSKELSGFNREKFLKLAEDKEGYLFPDSYFFEPETAPERIIETMHNNYIAKIATIGADLRKSKRKSADIIVMASILEEEARTEETRKMIADILWRRLGSNYPLQVDASFAYILNKGTSELTLNDLEVDSPYNTYKYAGLPPGPISNPGLSAIKDAIYPTPNKYWFYLSDREGNMHYAVTFDEHKLNKEKYLR